MISKIFLANVGLLAMSWSVCSSTVLFESGSDWIQVCDNESGPIGTVDLSSATSGYNISLQFQLTEEKVYDTLFTLGSSPDLSDDSELTYLPYIEVGNFKNQACFVSIYEPTEPTMTDYIFFNYLSYNAYAINTVYNALVVLTPTRITYMINGQVLGYVAAGGICELNAGAALNSQCEFYGSPVVPEVVDQVAVGVYIGHGGDSGHCSGLYARNIEIVA